MDRPWDCIVIGGGAAGLSAALVLGRARRRTLVVDDGRQSNLAAHGVGGLLGHDGRPPAELYAGARTELAAYPSVELLTGTVVAADGAEDGFLVALADGGQHAARRLLLAAGMDYRAPDVPGIAERWGRSVFHCPFCHGWEVRDRPLGVLDRGANAVHRALLLRAWSDDVTVLTDGPPELDDVAIAQLVAAGVVIDGRRVAALRGPGAELTDVVFTDGSTRALGGLLVPVVLHQRAALAARLGVVLAPPGMLAADAVDVDAWLQTSVPGVAAAGDVTGTMPSVANAIAAGSNAAAAIVRSLVAEVAA